MYYILDKDIALRSWDNMPFGFIRRFSTTFTPVSCKLFNVLLQADGLHDLDENSDAVCVLKQMELIHTCHRAEKKLKDWQTPRIYHNITMPAMNIAITGKCNFNCRHCLNAKDSERVNSELTLDEIEHILDEAVSCGIQGCIITGGEPLVHHDIYQIIEAIYKRNMYIEEFNTNGYFLDHMFLDYLQTFGNKPLIKISFDGIGFHDWMRMTIGAEKVALEALKLSVEKGFPTAAQINVNQINQTSIVPTLNLLDKMGVTKSRLLRTTEVPRWQILGNGQSFSINEYYEFAFNVIQQYVSEPHRMQVRVWQLIDLNPIDKTFMLSAIRGSDYAGIYPICGEARNILSVGSTGEIYPCMQLSGWLELKKISYGNVLKQKLHDILSEGKYADFLQLKTDIHLMNNSKCSGCRFFGECHGGCPGLSMWSYRTSDNPVNMSGEDSWKCCFFENDYKKKFDDLLKATGYRPTRY